MPRSVSGNYTLPLPPVVPNTVILSAWANTTLEDVAQALTNSLDRGGSGGMTAPFRLVDGNEGVPAFAFNAETGTGLWRNGPGVMAVSIQGDMVGFWSSNGYTGAFTGNMDGNFTMTGDIAFDGTTTFNGAATVDGLLTVNGDTTFNGQLNVDTLNCTDDAVFGSLFTVQGAATFNDPVLVNDFAEFTSGVTFDATITVLGIATFDTVIVSDLVRVGDTGIRPTQQLVGTGAFIIDGMTVDASGVGGRLVFLNGSDGSGVAFSAIYAVATRPSGGTGVAVDATGLIRSGSANPTFAFAGTGGGLVQLTIGGSAGLTLVTNFGI